MASHLVKAVCTRDHGLASIQTGARQLRSGSPRRTSRRLQTASMGLLRAFFSIAHTPTTMLGSVLGFPSSSASPGACVR